MIGAGMHVFAVWNYVITKARSGSVEINPKLLAFTLGGTEEEVEKALKFLEKPDALSRSKLEGGRRIIRDGQFQYRLVNWKYYQQIKNEDDRREYNRVKQAEYRVRNKGKSARQVSAESAGREARFVEASDNGDLAKADEIAAEGLPPGL